MYLDIWNFLLCCTTWEPLGLLFLLCNGSCIMRAWVCNKWRTLILLQHPRNDDSCVVGALSHAHQRGCWNLPEFSQWECLSRLLLGSYYQGWRALQSLQEMAGETDFLRSDCFSSFQGSPSEEWHVKFHELITSALRCYSLLKILTLYWFPMAFQKGRTLLIHHMRNLWYDIIRSWRQSKSRFQIPLLQNVYLSDLICWRCSDACNFLQGRLLECEDMAVMKKICMVGEPQTWVFELDLVKSTQCQH